MLRLNGTIPTVFKEITYQTPVSIWLTPSFPVEAPLCYVDPTRDMVVTQEHPYLTSTGFVQVPAIREYVPRVMHIMRVRALCACFVCVLCVRAFSVCFVCVLRVNYLLCMLLLMQSTRLVDIVDQMSNLFGAIPPL